MFEKSALPDFLEQFPDPFHRQRLAAQKDFRSPLAARTPIAVDLAIFAHQFGLPVCAGRWKYTAPKHSALSAGRFYWP